MAQPGKDAFYLQDVVVHFTHRVRAARNMPGYVVEDVHPTISKVYGDGSYENGVLTLRGVVVTTERALNSSAELAQLLQAESYRARMNVEATASSQSEMRGAVDDAGVGKPLTTAAGRIVTTVPTWQLPTDIKNVPAKMDDVIEKVVDVVLDFIPMTGVEGGTAAVRAGVSNSQPGALPYSTLDHPYREYKNRASEYPNREFISNGKRVKGSSAAGYYQFLIGTWDQFAGAGTPFTYNNERAAARKVLLTKSGLSHKFLAAVEARDAEAVVSSLKTEWQAFALKENVRKALADELLPILMTSTHDKSVALPSRTETVGDVVPPVTSMKPLGGGIFANMVFTRTHANAPNGNGALYGKTRNRKAWHAGIDVFAHEDDVRATNRGDREVDVYSPIDGTVVFAGPVRGVVNQAIAIRGNDGLVYTLWHTGLDDGSRQPLVKVGDKVTRATKIHTAIGADSGLSASAVKRAPHLHVMVGPAVVRNTSQASTNAYLVPTMAWAIRNGMPPEYVDYLPEDVRIAIEAAV